LLTPGEHRVLEQLVAGRSNKTAAYTLGLSSRTIETHRRHIMLKLKVHSMADLMRIALAAA
jgi:FixJ family two-component response regulator